MSAHDSEAGTEVATRRRWGTRGWVSGAQVVIAALLFMAITQLSQAIAIRGLALLGLRTDVATITEIEACGQKTLMAPAYVIHAEDERLRVEICSQDASRPGVKVTAAVPSGQDVTLLVNGRAVETRRSAAARVTFDGVALHGGDNTLAVAVGDRAVGELQFEDVRLTYHQSPFGYLRILPVGGPITVAVRQPDAAIKVLGGDAGPDGAFLLVSGPPDTSSHVAEIDEHAAFGPSGFAVVEAKALPDGTRALTADQFRRLATVSRSDSGDVVFAAEACLPKDSALAQWAVAGTLTAEDFVARLTDLEIDSAQRSVSSTLEISETADCRVLRGHVTIPFATVSRWQGNLLATPFDALHFEGFANRLRFSRAPSSSSGSDKVSFVGKWTPSHGDTVRVSTDYTAFNADLNDADEDEEVAPRATASPGSSLLASAWARAEDGLPSWLRALLSGVAAVAPVLVLLFAIRRTASNEPTVVAARADVTAGLSVLLLLALGAAVQPLVFQLFYRATEWLQVRDLLAETRGANSWIYPDTYSPVALAIAMMLAPFLRALRTRPDRPPSLLLGVCCGVASLAAVMVLFAAAVAQRLPWQQRGDVWPIALLRDFDITIEPGLTLPLVMAAVVVALLTAWVPLFWAFQSLAPRRGYFKASLLAGAAAIVFPLASYLVEAARLRFLPVEARYTNEPSFLALMGGALLPLTLFLVLLTAFREVIAAVVPEAQTERAKQWLRTRNLFIVAVLLTLPRLGLGHVAIAPSEMGIIDILSIFQSFGLVAAVLLTVILLRAYARLESNGDPVGESLRPFAFGIDELDVLAALFAGYLALWTSGILATVIVVAAGWPLFKRLIVEPDLVLPDSLATPELATALLDHRRDLALFAARGKEIETRYTKAQCDFAVLTQERQTIENERKTLEDALGMSAKEAKRRLLEFGPGSSPFANGVRGGLAGLGFAIVLQLATSIYGTDGTGALTSWADLARKALADPIYSIAPVGARFVPVSFDVLPAARPEFLLFIGALINASFPWVLLGFIFGFSFHRVRGDDGVIKGLVFAGAIAIAYAFSQLFAPGAGGIQVTRVMPVFLFLLLLGVGLFDATSLVRRKLSPTRLLDIYGFRTSLGYASLIGGVAAFEPIIRFLTGFFPRS